MTSLASKAKHIPFRNSKLTRLLEDSLSGQAKSMMFIHVAPEVRAAGVHAACCGLAGRVGQRGSACKGGYWSGRLAGRERGLLERYRAYGGLENLKV